MATSEQLEQFIQVAGNVGAEVLQVGSITEAVTYIAERVTDEVLLPDFSSGIRAELATMLKNADVTVVENLNRENVQNAGASVTGVNFALADTGTLVLESTAEDIRLATTLPEIHFALLDPGKILDDGLAAVEPLRQLQLRDARSYIAYITGPSRTADIERVLTIGVHGPKQLHILLVPGLSDDLLEM